MINQMNLSETLTIALTKGRVLDETLPLLEGIEPGLAENLQRSRKLVYGDGQYKFLLIRGSDVPTYVKHGAADLGIAGKDILLEHGSTGLYELLDLGICRCAFHVAGLKDEPAISGRIRVATKFMNIARRYFAQQGTQVELIKLNGALELAPIMGLAHRIVDIVETGNTLKANGLVPQAKIVDISTRLVVNAASMKTKFKLVQTFKQEIEAALAAQT